MMKDTLVNGITELNEKKEERLVKNTDRLALLRMQRVEKRAFYMTISPTRKDAPRAKQADERGQQHLRTLRKELELIRKSIEVASNSAHDGQDQQPKVDAKKWKIAPSQAQEEWDTWKKKESGNIHIDELMHMVGLEAVKFKFLGVLSTIETARRQEELIKSSNDPESRNAKPMSKCFHAAFIGNPGTGKTTVTTGVSLLRGGIKAVNQAILGVHPSRPEGVLLIDRPQQFATEQGREVVEYIIHEMARLEEKVAFVFAGNKRDMETFLNFDTRLRQRVYFDFKFEDFKYPEIFQLLKKQAEDKYGGKMRLEMGDDDLFMRVISRRIGWGRGKSEFGNVRDVEAAVKQIQVRQANRLAERRKAHQEADDFFFSKTDLIGLPPVNALDQSEAWMELNKLVGLDAVRQAVRVFVDRVQINYQRDLDEQPPVQISLNKVFLGSPGTGNLIRDRHISECIFYVSFYDPGAYARVADMLQNRLDLDELHSCQLFRNIIVYRQLVRCHRKWSSDLQNIVVAYATIRVLLTY
ncbi:aaa family protein [Rutstroemia sp. NJR-2017a WRK4]|nr:aaa family protein [Rutstroemia sp. NJR-2017a WRK4]